MLEREIYEGKIQREREREREIYISQQSNERNEEVVSLFHSPAIG
jgi:hypothetical protein